MRDGLAHAVEEAGFQFEDSQQESLEFEVPLMFFSVFLDDFHDAFEVLGSVSVALVFSVHFANEASNGLTTLLFCLSLGRSALFFWGLVGSTQVDMQILNLQHVTASDPGTHILRKSLS